MWTVLRFLNLFILLIIVISGSDAAADYTYVDIENDAIIIEAAPLDTEPTASREKRNLEVARQTWAEALGEGSPCLSSRGILGSCTTFRHCYPYIKLPNLGVWESWVLGNHDTCSYFNTEGVQTTGVCCTNPVTLVPDEENATMAGENDVGQEVGSSSNLQDTKYQNWPPPVPTHPTNPTNRPVIIQWPPPVPTHPPNHHYPTHPPTQNYPMPGQSTTKKPTYPPWSTTKKPSGYPPQRPPQRPPQTPPPWQQTTKKPPSTSPWPGSWPPQAPTHPTTTTTHKPPQGVETPFQPGCGAKNGNLDQERIVGGQNSIPNEWPWMAALFKDNRQFCGGSLIDNIHILSAAHCVAHMSSWDVARIKVNLADHNIKVTNEVAHVERKVKRIIRHKGFEFRTLYSDIAILTMDRPVEFTKTVSPICLPAATTKAYNGKLGTVAGWGSLRENGPQPSVLQKVSVPIWSNQECASKYGNAAPGGIISSMICAGRADKDSCSGDSGGPLMVNEGRWEQVGIVSWGIGCGKGQYPGVYTRVTAFMPWIKKNIQMNLLR